MRDHHAFIDRHERRGLLDRLIAALAVALLVTLFFVWAAGELAGGIWDGSWPDVPCVQSAAGYFTVLFLLVVAAAAVVIWTWRLLHRPRVYWAPPPLLGRGADRAFIRAYQSGRPRRWR